MDSSDAWVDSDGMSDDGGRRGIWLEKKREVEMTGFFEAKKDGLIRDDRLRFWVRVLDTKVELDRRAACWTYENGSWVDRWTKEWAQDCHGLVNRLLAIQT